MKEKKNCKMSVNITLKTLGNEHIEIKNAIKNYRFQGQDFMNGIGLFNVSDVLGVICRGI